MLDLNEILTVHGVAMDPFSPEPGQIRIDDIAHALSMLVRANGHIDRFYSVAQHSLNCEREAAARGFAPSTRRFCLLHDATECYLADLTRPVKRRLPQYREAEAGLQRVIFAALCGAEPTDAQQRQIGEVDDCLLQHEFLRLRGVKLLAETPEMLGDCDFFVRPIEEIERQFLEQYHILSGR
ncbi:MAG: phosphohydrolase [Oscillospiraceae bacterium]